MPNLRSISPLPLLGALALALFLLPSRGQAQELGLPRLSGAIAMEVVAPEAGQGSGQGSGQNAQADSDGDEGGEAREPEEADPPGGGAASNSDDAEYEAQLRQRQEIAPVHRALGIATWSAMLVTVTLGLIQFNNLYGTFSPVSETPCTTGNATFGQEACWGTPWPHRIAAFTTAALYTTTFALSFVMPDPDDLANGRGQFAENLRTHKALRWVHFAGMLAQMFLGLSVANNWFGIDRANNYDAMMAISTVHNVIGLGTFAAMTAAGALMVF